MNFDKMSEKLQEIIMQAVEICKSYQHTTVDTIQMLKAILNMMCWMAYQAPEYR